MTTQRPVEQAIEALLSEQRTFPPSPEFVAQSAIQDRSLFERADADLKAFWAQEAESLSWYRKWDTVLEWNPPFAKWFNGGQLNVSYNCLDRHVEAGRGNKIAYYWEGEPGDRREITYKQLLDEVCQCANALKELGVARGDRVAIYMPMIPELPIAMLACARIGAPHTVVFGGFSATALSDRIIDAEAKLVITADGGYRRGSAAGLKGNVDEALQSTPTIQHALVVKRTGQDVSMTDGRDVWWHDIVPQAGRDLRAGEDGERGHALPPLHLRNDRQTEGHPAHDRRLSARRQPQPTAGSSISRRRYLLGGRGYRLGHRPHLHRLRSARERHDRRDLRGHARLPIVGALVGDHRAVQGLDPLHRADRDSRPHEAWAPQHAEKHDLSSLRVLGTVGEPINPEAWIWYHEHIGQGRCPVVDTWWQTETGGT